MYIIADAQTATDVAGEMSIVADTFRWCKTCSKACTAAVEMLAVSGMSFDIWKVTHDPQYKCRIVPRQLDQLNLETLNGPIAAEANL
jgi:hypothetical protein